MKLICPGCALKGTAGEPLLNANARHPGCLCVFKLDGDVTVDFPPAQMNSAGESVTAEQHEVAECASCGLRCSRAYLTEIDSGLYYQICVSAGLQAEAAS